MKVFCSLILSLVILCSCLNYNPPEKLDLGGNLPLESLTLPDGFNIEVYAENVVNARSMTCLLYASPSPRDATLSRMPSSA